MSRKCSGFDALSGSYVELSFGTVIEAADRPKSAPAEGTWLAPGFIDLQVNGFKGVDFCAPGATVEEIGRAIEAILATGTTRFFPTVITGQPETMIGSIRMLTKARKELARGRAMEAFHIEGPHISPADGPRGAHPKAAVRRPSIEEFERWQEAAEGNIGLVTVSAEWDETPAYIAHITRRGVVAAIGHMDATEAQIEAAVEAGATVSTHLGNGANASLPRHPNYLWTQMAEDRLAASLIVDGIHLGRAFMRVAMRSKGLERIVLITDAAGPAGCAPGPYRLGEVDVILHAGGKVTLTDGQRLAGSSLHMDRGVENLMKICGLTLAEAVALATRNPARVGRVAGRQRGLEAGDRADIVEFDYDRDAASIRVKRTWLDGELVYQAA
ncbi:MAG: N-acetylglucosamine-6-phosphate deacetylase [Candidatus Solibacter sp.]|nr:N-acetylglucosamine-6-phosphate deacetylase [Candidatus Solibacter sp.]